MLIQNYGLFWRRDNVFWGRQNNKGKLEGYPAKAKPRSGKNGNVVNFRDQQGIYCLYDELFRLVYVGQAGANDKQRLFGRLKTHTTDQLAARWERFSWFGLGGKSVQRPNSLLRQWAPTQQKALS